MSRLIRTTIVLGIALATLAVSPVFAADLQSEEPDTVTATQPAAVTDAHERATTTTSVSTDSFERAQPSDVTVLVASEDTGWSISLVDVLLAAAIGVGIVAAGVLLAGAIRRSPHAGHPPLAHR